MIKQDDLSKPEGFAQKTPEQSLGNTSLKDELEAETKAAYRHKVKAIIIGLIVLTIGTISTVGAVAHTRPSSNPTSRSSDIAQITTDINKDATPASTSSNAIAAPQTGAPKSTGISSSSQTSTAQSVPASPQAIDRTTFIASANKVIADYNQIVGLVSFNQSTPDNTKSAAIDNAHALDLQYFSQVTSLRAQINDTSITSGPYLQATQMAEDGASKISLGIDTVEYWVNDHSRRNELTSGAGEITQGADVLVGLSQQLNNL